MQLLEKTVLIVFVAIMLLFSIGALFAPHVIPQNTTYVTGHFLLLRKDVNRGSVSYALFLEENNDNYRISAEWIECFSAKSFLGGVKQGQLVQLYLRKSFLSAPTVTNLTSEGVTYIGLDCVNDDIDKDRYKIPLMFMGVSVFAIALYRLRKVRLR